MFGELMLLPQSVLDDPVERAAFTKALAGAADRLLSFDGEAEAEAEAEAEEGGKETQRTQRTQRTQQTQRGHRRWRRSSTSTNVVPTLRFDRLLGELTSLAPRFAFQVPIGYYLVVVQNLSCINVGTFSNLALENYHNALTLATASTTILRPLSSVLRPPSSVLRAPYPSEHHLFPPPPTTPSCRRTF